MVKWQLFGGATPAGNVDTVGVIGMGRFGRALAEELMAMGIEVLAIDSNEKIIQDLDGAVTYPVTADSTNEKVLRQLAVHELECVVVAIGSSVEASILTTSHLINFGVPQIWAKAMSDAHQRILQQIGVRHIVYPEAQTGRRLAHVLRGSLTDYIELGDGLVLVRTTPPADVVGRRIRDVHIRSTYGVTVISRKSGDGPWGDVTGDTVLEADDQILVTGPSAKAENFNRRD